MVSGRTRSPSLAFTSVYSVYERWVDEQANPKQCSSIRPLRLGGCWAAQMQKKKTPYGAEVLRCDRRRWPVLIWRCEASKRWRYFARVWMRGRDEEERRALGDQRRCKWRMAAATIA